MDDSAQITNLLGMILSSRSAPADFCTIYNSLRMYKSHVALDIRVEILCFLIICRIIQTERPHYDVQQYSRYP